MSKTLTELKKNYEEAETYWSPLYSEFEKLESMYWGKKDKPKNADDKWRSKAVDNIAFEAVERMTSHLFASNPKGRYLPMKPSNQYGGIVNNALFNFQWSNPKLNMHLKMRHMGVQMAVFGIAFGTLDWKYTEKETKKVEFSGEEEIETVTTEVDCDQPWFKPLYIYDCYPDPSATCIEDMQFFIYDEYVGLKELKDRNRGQIKHYTNLGKLEEKIKETEASQNEHRNNVDRGQEDKPMKDRILVRTEVSRSKRRAYAPDYGIVIQDTDNPYDHKDLNVHMLVDYAYPNQLFGRGEIEPIKTLQKALNSVLNQRLDNVRLILNAGFKVKATSKYMHTWKMRPGWKVLVEDMSDIEPFTIPDVTSKPFLETTGYFKDSVFRTLGYTDFLTRNETEGDKTATEIRASMGEQNARMKDKEKYIDSFMIRLANQWRELNRQFISNKQTVRILGSDAQKMIKEHAEEKKKERFYEMLEQNPELYDLPQEQLPEVPSPYHEVDNVGFLEIEPNDLGGDYDYIVESGSLTEVDPAQKVQSLVMAIKMLQENEQALGKDGIKVKVRPLLEMVLRELGVKNTENILQQMSDQEQAQAAQVPMQQMVGRGRQQF